MGVKIESIGISKDANESLNSNLELVQKAVQNCFCNSKHSKKDISLIINVSMYRDEYFGEPAFATVVQNDLKLNPDSGPYIAPSTCAFDLVNGSLGFLNGCHVVKAMMTEEKLKTALIVSGDIVDITINEVEPSPGFFITGTAMLLKYEEDKKVGFGPFLFKGFDGHIVEDCSCTYYENKQLPIIFQKDSSIEKTYLSLISNTASVFLAKLDADISEFDMIIPPQISSRFTSKLAKFLGVDYKKFICATQEGVDLFNASLPMAMSHVFKDGRVLSDKKALIINIGYGFHVGCAVYNF